MRAFFYTADVQKGECVFLDKDEHNHLFKILRGRAGETLLLLDGKGKKMTAEIQPDKSLKILDIEQCAEPEQKIYIFTAAPRKQKLDMLLKQCCELGVDGICIMQCDFSVANPDNMNRFRELLTEGCKQSNNPFMPEIIGPLKMKQAVDYVKEKGMLGVFGAVKESEGDKECLKKAGAVAFFVGPEGGFSPQEIELIEKENFVGISLSPYILRLETAVAGAIPLLREFMK
jgi:16S rRNA (uracil1498-N3)-methyltransferase